MGGTNLYKSRVKFEHDLVRINEIPPLSRGVEEGLGLGWFGKGGDGGTPTFFSRRFHLRRRRTEWRHLPRPRGGISIAISGGLHAIRPKRHKNSKKLQIDTFKRVPGGKRRRISHIWAPGRRLKRPFEKV